MAHILELVEQGLEAEDEMDGYQLSVSLTNTSDLNTLLRSRMLAKLMLGVTYLLSTKTAKK